MALSPNVSVSLCRDGQKCLCADAEISENEILLRYDGPTIDHPTRYSIQIDDHRHIEGTPESNACLNHSCMPNAYVDWSGVYLRALRSIPTGERNYVQRPDYRLGTPREFCLPLWCAAVLR